MPKMKTHRGAAKRLSRTGSGRIRRNKANKSHILTKKTRKRKRGLRHGTLVAKVDEGRVNRMLPYGG
ncbi:MAG: 50S ribosomal protein L35 [Gemmatimonadota bacterium]|nr:50S ribosomal protein L35 [Gemmatimonadota bacterium]MDH5759530.1 50S ribosomal protein L35 [Gemmatimonadota bacterium]